MNASSNQAPGKRWRDRMSDTPTPKMVLSGTAMATTMRVSSNAWRPSGVVKASHADPSPGEKAW